MGILTATLLLKLTVKKTVKSSFLTLFLTFSHDWKFLLNSLMQSSLL